MSTKVDSDTDDGDVCLLIYIGKNMHAFFWEIIVEFVSFRLASLFQDIIIG